MRSTTGSTPVSSSHKSRNSDSNFEYLGTSIEEAAPKRPPFLLLTFHFSSYGNYMPYKDPVKRKEAARVASLAYYYRQLPKKAPGTCSTCPRPVDEPGFKKCLTCRKRMRAFKKAYRAVEKKPEGICSRADCKREARPGLRLCKHCADLYSKKTKTPAFKTARKSWRDVIREEVIQAYGAACECCREPNVRLLTIDHIDGYESGPRSGFALYLWLRRNSFPEGFRVLCMKCNFTLGHHGYCPHSTLKQSIKLGRPCVNEERAVRLRANKRAYSQKLKMECLNAYGGPVCSGCGEDHHECLSVDHVANDGAVHRKADKRARNLYILLRAVGYPPGFQVLCMNCNHLKHVSGLGLTPTNSAQVRSTIAIGDR